jgi:hypothetical protein
MQTKRHFVGGLTTLVTLSRFACNWIPNRLIEVRRHHDRRNFTGTPGIL